MSFNDPFSILFGNGGDSRRNNANNDDPIILDVEADGDGPARNTNAGPSGSSRPPRGPANPRITRKPASGGSGGSRGSKILIGVVLAYLMSLQLRQFGAEAFIVNILGISLIRELGPMLGAILVAGRSGSAITAQIGVMRVTEELDAMRVMGISHGFRLVLPRALALAVSMPLVALWTILAALAGGMVAADLTMDITPSYFIQSLPAAVKIGNLVLAMGKSVVFGVLIALIGCHWGLKVEPNTQSLGRGTTAAVVSSITMVIIVDAIFAILFRNVGF